MIASVVEIKALGRFIAAAGRSGETCLASDHASLDQAKAAADAEARADGHACEAQCGSGIDSQRSRPFLPPSHAMQVLPLDSRTVTWKIAFTCELAAAAAISDLTITARVDHLADPIVPNEGDETLADQADNAQATLKGLQVVNP